MLDHFRQNVTGALFRSILIIAWMVLGLCLAIQAMNAQSDTHNMRLDIAAWRQDYAACFDKRGNPQLSKLRTFLPHVEGEWQRAQNSLPPEQSLYLLEITASAHTQSGDWEEAKQENLQIIREGSSTDLFNYASLQLAGLYAIQTNWRPATYHYLRWMYSIFINSALPALICSWLWLALWHFGTRRSHGERPPAAGRLVLFAFIPLTSTLCPAAGRLINSYLLTGNAFASALSYRLDKHVNQLILIEWETMLLVSVYFLWKKDRSTQIKDDILPVLIEEVSGQNMRWRRLKSLVSLPVMVMSGLLLYNFGRIEPLFDILKRLPTLAASIHDAFVDPWWIIGLLTTTILVPIAEEAFFRGVVYPYSCKIGGVGFALVFSSLIFAGMHMHAEQFPTLFLAGIVFATQYELRKKIDCSVINHSLINFFAYLPSL